MEKKEFKTESKRLLDLMINSIYTKNEIFLREIISNASDAIDKLFFVSLTDDKVGINRNDFAIEIKADKENRILTVSDNGIGMDKDTLEANLGTIAKSGSLQFKEKLAEQENNKDIDIIGQFGVGFYSAFMVSDAVTVITKAYGADKGYKWESTGADGYTITECDKATVGTDVIMKIKEDTEEENYGQYLESYKINSLVKKYSDYIRYPIRMEVEKSKLKEGSDKDYEKYTEVEVLNSMIPLWNKNKNDVTEEEYSNFYKDKFSDFEDPLKHIYVRAEGTVEYKALLFIPSKTPYDYYTKEYKKGLQLYSSGVLIMDNCEELLPEHFRFVKGVVDSQDLSLNISRELLQHNRKLKTIASHIEKKIKSELLDMLKNEREKYETFFKSFGLQFKYAIANDYGMKKDLLQDLLMFYSSAQGKLITLKEYVDAMKEDQKSIYYAVGETVKKIDQLPQTEIVKDKGYDILYFTESVDEFAIQMLREFEGKEFKSVNNDDIALDSEEEKKNLEKAAEENKDLLTFAKESLGDKVKEVRISKKLKSHPVILSSDGPLSLDMEKYLNSVQQDNMIKADRVLELNPSHPIFKALSTAYREDKEKAKKYVEILYTQGLLIAGFPIEDPAAYSDLVCSLMV